MTGVCTKVPWKGSSRRCARAADLQQAGVEAGQRGLPDLTAWVSGRFCLWDLAYTILASDDSCGEQNQPALTCRQTLQHVYRWTCLEGGETTVSSAPPYTSRSSAGAVAGSSTGAATAAAAAAGCGPCGRLAGCMLSCATGAASAGAAAAARRLDAGTGLGFSQVRTRFVVLCHLDASPRGETGCDAAAAAGPPSCWQAARRACNAQALR